ncbi:MAG TPA: DUF6328 family protein [Burkholderiales bacterium]|nr:DUF6328 family protein [Burkholderiales bacterium]
MPFLKPQGTGRKEDISLESAAGHVLEECRMVLPGVQALFGFQLIAVFNQGFAERLSHPEQVLHLIAIALTVLSMALVMTPAALHRQAEPREVSERFIWIGSNLVLAGMLPLALAIGIDAYIVSSLIIRNDTVAIAIGAAVVTVFAALWFFLPRREARKHA